MSCYSGGPFRRHDYWDNEGKRYMVELRNDILYIDIGYEIFTISIEGMYSGRNLMVHLAVENNSKQAYDINKALYYAAQSPDFDFLRKLEIKFADYNPMSLIPIGSYVNDLNPMGSYIIDKNNNCKNKKLLIV